MNRRNLLRALFLAPLVPVAAKSAMLEGPPVVTAVEPMKVLVLGETSLGARKVWSRNLWTSARDNSYFERLTGEDGPIILRSGSKQGFNLLR